ncbi:hypothetical protein [Bdellovibrio sp. HCB2-146]|uniref:spermine/spermidine synthase domain-containing protein n=1 Tax=Bdellovibrio sp. HCB2-146 TaxID=3394362 RepID=UPI0039BCBE53
MILLALISGLINLSSQVVFQKVVSMVVGDLYTTFIAVSLTFILGSAIGSYFGHRFRPYLAYIEMAAGFLSLVVFGLLQGPFYSQDIPLPFVIACLFLPALALGTHIPLYSYYLRRIKFGWIYFVYHFGAIFGLIAFEWNFVNAGSTSGAVLLVALIQLSLGGFLLLLTKRKVFVLETTKISEIGIVRFVQTWPLSTLSVFSASLVSFYSVYWALKTQSMMTNSYRLHATSISAAVFFWMSSAGLFNRVVKYLSKQVLFVCLSLSLLFISMTFKFAGPGITSLYSGELVNYFCISFLLSIYLTLPVLFSSLLFVRETSVIQSKLDVDVASGTLNLFASFGNIAGFICAALMIHYLWEPGYFTIAVVFCSLQALFLSYRQKTLRTLFPVIVLVLALTPFLVSTAAKDALFVNRLKKGEENCQHIRDVRILSHPLTSVALYTYAPIPLPLDSSKCFNPPSRRMYVVDGLGSHNIWWGDEYISGIASAKFFSRPLEKSLVVGIGTGQSAWGVAAISKHADLVDISPAVMENLAVFKEYNRDLLHRANVSFYLKDGFGFVRDCKKGSYNLILNTSTQPSSYNAAKLYSDEFVGLAKECLSSDGILQTYFDPESVNNMLQFEEYIAPILKHFRYVDIMLKPYPFVFASNTRHSLHVLNKNSFIDPRDFDFFTKIRKDQSIFSCVPFYKNISSVGKNVEMSTLDRSYIERNTVRNSVYLYHKQDAPLNLFEDFARDHFGTPTCE